MILLSGLVLALFSVLMIFKRSNNDFTVPSVRVVPQKQVKRDVSAVDEKKKSPQKKRRVRKIVEAEQIVDNIVEISPRAAEDVLKSLFDRFYCDSGLDKFAPLSKDGNVEYLVSVVVFESWKYSVDC